MEITIRDLVDLIVELTGYSGKVQWDKTKPDGQPKRSLDVSRAKQEFGFEAKMPFKKGLKNTIEWYQEHSGILTEPANLENHC
jgi:GDP-L-fucose synthase